MIFHENLKNIAIRVKKYLFGDGMSKKINYTSKEIPILKEQLKAILKNGDSKEGVVISLQGNWGIGKTYFWHDFAKYNWNENEHVYISLFGKHKLEDIKKQIVLKVYDRNKIAKFVDSNPIIGKIIETKWGLDASLIANTFTKETFKGIVLCFDDFERISPNLSITEILGFIAELKEQHKCKIIIINNNDSLKEQDELNHKKILTKVELKKDKDSIYYEKLEYGQIVKEYETKEKFFISQTNNQEIFDRFSEKIIDYKLYYEPHYSDNLNLVKDEGLQFVDWKFVEELLSRIENKNKQCNIRLMKQFVAKLKLFKESIDATIHSTITKSIVSSLFKKTYNETKIPVYMYSNIDTLSEFIDTVVKKHYLDKENFVLELNRLNLDITRDDIKTKVYDDTHKIYEKFLYDLKYPDAKFSEDLYALFNDNKTYIVKIVSIRNFQFYINVMKKVDRENEEKYDNLYIEAMKKYIDIVIQDLQNKPSVLIEYDLATFNEKIELKDYFEEKRNSLVSDVKSNMQSIIEAMHKPKQNNGWGPGDETLLSSISIAEHIEWIKEDAKYLQTCFDFVRWVRGFSGSIPFKNAHDNIVEAIKTLAKEDSYKNKLEMMINFFENKQFL